MQAARVHQFGGPDAIVIDELERPRPGVGEVLVRVYAAGVGPWDAWVRSGRSVLPQPLPLTLGSDLSGVIVAVGPEVQGFAVDDAVFGVTNRQFTGAYADHAVATAATIAPKPAALDHLHAAAVPVVAVTALQMVADVRPGQRVLVLGSSGNVGAYAVALARLAGAHVIGIDVDTAPLDRAMTDIDVIVDTVGGELAASAVSTLVSGGLLISSVAKPAHVRSDVRADFLLVDVTTEALGAIARYLELGRLAPRLGSVLPLADARAAHEMLAGTRPRLPGKIVLDISGSMRSAPTA